MNSTKRTARIARVLYLVNAVTGFFGIIHVPGNKAWQLSGGIVNRQELR